MPPARGTRHSLCPGLALLTTLEASLRTLAKLCQNFIADGSGIPCHLGQRVGVTKQGGKPGLVDHCLIDVGHIHGDAVHGHAAMGKDPQASVGVVRGARVDIVEARLARGDG